MNPFITVSSIAAVLTAVSLVAQPQYQPPSSITGLLDRYRSYSNLTGVSQNDEVYAVNITTWQMSHGGFSKAMESNYLNSWDGSADLSEWYSGNTPLGMYDNDATVSEIRFLANQYNISGSSSNRTLFKNAIANAIDFILVSQHSSGSWPQVYPMRTGTTYSNLATYNDNAMIRLMVLIKDIVDGRSPFDGDVVSNSDKNELESALGRGVDFALNTQIVNGGELTVWCQQHDPVTYAPMGARSYELPSKSGSESVGIIAFLMNWPDQTAEIQAAVRGGLNWYADTRVPDMAWESPDFVSSPGASLWYRFYNVNDNQEFFCDRDGIKVYDITQISMERRTGYQWGGDYGSGLLNVAADYNPLNNTGIFLVDQASPLERGSIGNRERLFSITSGIENGVVYNIQGKKLSIFKPGRIPTAKNVSEGYYILRHRD